MIIKTLFRKTFILFFALLFSLNAKGQVNGDYQSRAGGNWNSNTTWQVRTGGSWVNCGPGDYPGASAGAGTVNIRDNHTITITANVPNNIEIGRASCRETV